MDSHAIPTEKIVERLRFENLWWKTGDIAPALAAMERRLFFAMFFPLVQDVSVRRAVILMGPRRVGKTVMMHHAIHALLEQGIAPSAMQFIGIDNPLYIHLGLEDLFGLARKASGREDPAGQYVFFDEIQYLKDWERHLKVLVDSYPQTKFIASGSATASVGRSRLRRAEAGALQLKSDESGAGRFHDFMLPPLTFQEFLHLQGMQGMLKQSPSPISGFSGPFFTAIDIKELNQQFFRYLNYGGYPEVLFNESIRGNMARYIKSDIIDKVLLRDLPSLYGIKDVQELNRFFTYLAYNTGREFSPNKISKDSGLNRNIINRYMEYLEAAFMIKVIHKVDDNARYFKRVTSFKVYLVNPSLRTALFAPVRPTDDEAGSLVETGVFAQWMHHENKHLHYAKWKSGRKEGEVDAVLLDQMKLKPAWALEIKWSNRYASKPGELKSLLEFCHATGLRTAICTSIDKQIKHTIDGVELTFMPVATYAYVIGARALNADPD